MQQTADSIMVSYRGTHVFCAKRIGEVNWKITLNTGGWFTATTKLRMNQAANQFGFSFNVFQQKGAWYVRNHAGIFEFSSNMFSFDDVRR